MEGTGATIFQEFQLGVEPAGLPKVMQLLYNERSHRAQAANNNTKGAIGTAGGALPLDGRTTRAGEARPGNGERR